MRNKYGAVKTTTDDGITHDSAKEARRWDELRLLHRAGEIRELKRQVVIKLEGKNGPLLSRKGRQMKLTVDFQYRDRARGWAVVHEDSKGFPTRDFEVRWAAANAMGIEVELT